MFQMRLIIIIAIIGLLMLASCSEQDVKKSESTTDTNSIDVSLNNDAQSDDGPIETLENQEAQELAEKEAQEKEEQKFTCEDWAKTLIPNAVTVYEGEITCDRYVSGKWRDGTVIKINARGVEFVNDVNKRVQVLQGAEVGEDASKYYIKAFNGDLVNLRYEKEAKQGSTILGVNEFEIKVKSYERLDSTRMQADSSACEYYEYKIDNYEVELCNRVG